jgi:ribosomal protein S18 acetylase RimI-like enzyme
MYTVKVLENKETARKIGEFLTSENAFDQTWAPNEKAMVMQAPLESLKSENHCYWYVENNGQIIGAIGVRENKYRSVGYEMNADYIAVHKDHRRRGIASMLIEKMENFVKERKGRYIHILTCDIESYKPALEFYENNGYKKVAELPNYYVEGEGRIDYLKELE